MNNSFSEAEDLVLGECYFVISYAELKEEAGIEEESLHLALKNLISKGYLRQLEYSDEWNDYVDTKAANFTRFEDFHYLASKEGLFAHNRRD